MLKKISLIFAMILLIGSVSALTATRNFSDNNISISETIAVSIDVDGTGSVLYGVNEYVPNNWIIDNSSINEAGAYDGIKITWLFLDNNNRVLTYNVTAPATFGVYDFTGNYTDGVDMFEVSGQTQVIVNSNETEENETEQNQTDDLMVNYVRGKIIIDNENSPAGTNYQVRVLNGTNSGYIYNGTVDDSNIPDSLKNNGYFDTNDKIGFSTGASFMVSVAGFDNCHANGIFENGGNGNFNTQAGLVNLNCSTINNVPVLGSIGNKQVNENQLLEFSVNATDIDNNTLSYSVTDLPIGATFINKVFSWTPDFAQSGIYWILFNVTDGEMFDEENITITVNNVNRVPVLEDIENQTILEDGSGSVLANATDLDNDALTYTITGENVSKVDCSVEGDNITFTPASNWHGNASCKVNVSDGSGTDSKIFYIEVQPVNDAPVLNSISNITANEGDLIKISASATDVDGDSLVYNINDTRFINSGGNFTWQTNYTNEGVYSVNISVSDGALTDNQIVKITVNHANEPPHIVPIANITIDEDSGFVNDIVISATDNDGVIASYEVSEENTNEVDCSVSDSKLGVTPAKDFYGAASCVIKVYDNEGASDETIVYIIVNNINDAPKIISFSPNFNPIIAEDSTYDFSITWEDIDNTEAEIMVKWYKNGVQVGIGDDYVFSDGAVGIFNITAVVSDGSASKPKEWNLTTSNIPITNIFDGYTTNFTGMNDAELASVDLILEKTGIGKIEFLESVDLRDVIDLDAYASIINSIITIDSAQLVSLKNRLAKIVFYNLDFEKTPTIYYNAGFTLDPGSITQVCPDSICSNISYENHDLTFYVSSFSSFMTGDTGTCSQQGGNICGENEVCEGGFLEAGDNDFCCATACVPAFSDAKTCEIKNSSIEIRIKNPNDNENFKVGDIIKAKIKIENKFDEKLNFDVEVYLYDLDEDESIEDKEENIKINEGESGTIELEIKIPDDVEGNNFAIYVFVEDDEYCNSDYVEIEIEREKHNVIIEDIEIFPQTVSSGGHVEVNVKVANIGGSDEDVYIEIENYLLNISEKSEEFEIEEYDEDDTEIKTFYINIPKDVEDGEYTIKASVIFDDGDDSASETFSVFTEKIFKQNETSQNAISLKPVSKDVKETSSSLLSFFVIAIFIISIGILVVLIVTAKKD